MGPGGKTQHRCHRSARRCYRSYIILANMNYLHVPSMSTRSILVCDSCQWDAPRRGIKQLPKRTINSSQDKSNEESWVAFVHAQQDTKGHTLLQDQLQSALLTSPPVPAPQYCELPPLPFFQPADMTIRKMFHIIHSYSLDCVGLVVGESKHHMELN